MRRAKRDEVHPSFYYSLASTLLIITFITNLAAEAAKAAKICQKCRLSRRCRQ